MEPDTSIDPLTEKERKIYEDINRINFIKLTMRNEPFYVVNVENPHINLVWHLLVTFMRFRGIKISDNDTQIQYVNIKGETFNMFKEERGIGIPKKDLRKVAPWIDGDGMYHYTSLEADGKRFRIKGLDEYAEIVFYKYDYELDIISKLSIKSKYKDNERFDVVRIERYPFEDIESIIKGNEPEENLLWETMKKVLTGLGYDMSEDGNLIIIGEKLILLKFGKGFITLSSYEQMKGKEGVNTKDFYYTEIMGLDMETDSEGRVKEGVKFKIVLASVTNFECLVIETKPNARSIRGMKRIRVWIGNVFKTKNFKTHYVRIGKEDEIQLDGYNINYLN